MRILSILLSLVNTSDVSTSINQFSFLFHAISLKNSFKENGDKAELLAGILTDASVARERDGGVGKVSAMLLYQSHDRYV